MINNEEQLREYFRYHPPQTEERKQAYGYYEVICVELPPFTIQVDSSRIEGVIASCKRRITAASGVPHQLLNGESEVASCEQIDRGRLWERLRGHLFEYHFGQIYDFPLQERDRLVAPEGAIGNIDCINNAHSPHLRCAVNPCGPCEGCSHFEIK